MNYALPVPEVPSVAIDGLPLRFPVRRIFCIGRNYAEHAKEMGGNVDKASPMFFTKPADALVTDGADVPYPSATSDLHHEVEMVVALKAGGSHIDPVDAHALVYGYGIGLDLTRRDLQAAAKAKGAPWDTAKGFDHSAPISMLVPADRAGVNGDTPITLFVNGQKRQSATLGEMVHSVPEIIAALSKLYELKAGDLIYTGTPAGVAALQRGDRFEATLGNIVSLEGRIV